MSDGIGFTPPTDEEKATIAATPTQWRYGVGKRYRIEVDGDKARKRYKNGSMQGVRVMRDKFARRILRQAGWRNQHASDRAVLQAHRFTATVRKNTAHAHEARRLLLAELAHRRTEREAKREAVALAAKITAPEAQP